jgi:hypothetical protein
MKPPRISFSERDQYFAKIDRLNNLRKRKQRLYNRFYRRSLIYISTLVLRIIFLTFFTWIYFYQGGSGKISDEVVVTRESGIYLQSRNMKVAKLCFTTNIDSYEAHFEWTGMPNVSPGDTIQIEHNIFGKATFLTARGWNGKYELSLNWILYFIIGMLTIVSFSFNDGLDPFTDKILWVAWTIDLFAFTYYFLM